MDRVVRGKKRTLLSLQQVKSGYCSLKTPCLKRIVSTNIIYKSLLLEGRAGNLTKSTLEVVLAQKPPAWLQVMYERLKHLIISSETFPNKMRMGYGVRVETKLDWKDRLLGSERQEEFQTMSALHSLSKDKLTNSGTIGILDD